MKKKERKERRCKKKQTKKEKMQKEKKVRKEAIKKKESRIIKKAICPILKKNAYDKANKRLQTKPMMFPAY